MAATEKRLIRNFEDEFPGNSNKDKEQRIDTTPKEKNISQIVTGKVIKQKKSLGQKISETFFGDDTRSVSDYILQDVLIPAMKSTLSDMVGGGIEMLLFGERRRSSTSNIYRDRDRSYVPYNKMSRRDDRRDDRYAMTRTARSRHDFDDIILETRGEAEDVLSHMVDLIQEYDNASVADYYELVGVDANFTDNNYGWTNLRDAYVERVRRGYSIRLPQPKEI